MGADAQRDLLFGLIGTLHRGRYQQSPMFKNAIDGLVQILPHMVNGIAMEAEKNAASEKVLYEALMSQGVFHRTPDDGLVAMNPGVTSWRNQ